MTAPDPHTRERRDPQYGHYKTVLLWAQGTAARQDQSGAAPVNHPKPEQAKRRFWKAAKR